MPGKRYEVYVQEGKPWYKIVSGILFSHVGLFLLCILYASLGKAPSIFILGSVRKLIEIIYAQNNFQIWSSSEIIFYLWLNLSYLGSISCPFFAQRNPLRSLYPIAPFADAQLFCLKFARKSWANGESLYLLYQEIDPWSHIWNRRSSQFLLPNNLSLVNCLKPLHLGT